MRNLTDIKEKLNKSLPMLKKKYPIKYLAVFGSFSRNENKETSDIDVLVEFNEPVGIEFINLAEELEAILETRVDLVSRNAIKPQYFEQIKNDLQYV
jgi:predicted nucleotidyltransferase